MSAAQDQKDIVPAHAERPLEDIELSTGMEQKNLPVHIKQLHADLYIEALERYGQDGTIDPAAEKKLKRKLDRIILPILGVLLQ